MVRKTFVLDTNIFLHDPMAITKFADNDVVIPLSVLDELDGLKRSPDERGKNARDVLRYIDSLNKDHVGDFHKGIDIPEGPKVKIFFETFSEKRKDFPLSLEKMSHRTIFVAYVLRDAFEKVIFVSKDFVSRVKAEALGLEAEDYENLKVSYEGIYKGIRQIHVSKKEIDIFYKDGILPLASVPCNDAVYNEYFVLTTPERSSAVCRYEHKTKMLEPLIKRERGVWGLQPLNVEQRCVLDLLFRDDIPLVTLMGPAGTGKTLLALACGISRVFDDGIYSRLLVSRPIVPLGKDIGFLPGTKEEKLFHWMQPIYDNLEFLCESSSGTGNGAATLEWVMESKKIEMEAVTYIRGRSLPKMYIIIDEAQNLTPHEVKTIVSRAGKGTKVILTGDPTQIDNPYLDKDSNGLTYAVSKFRNQALFGHVFLDKTERSELAALATDIMS